MFLSWPSPNSPLVSGEWSSICCEEGYYLDGLLTATSEIDLVCETFSYSVFSFSALTSLIFFFFFLPFFSVELALPSLSLLLMPPPSHNYLSVVGGSVSSPSSSGINSFIFEIVVFCIWIIFFIFLTTGYSSISLTSASAALFIISYWTLFEKNFSEPDSNSPPLDRLFTILWGIKVSSLSDSSTFLPLVRFAPAKYALLRKVNLQLLTRLRHF